MTEEKNKRKRKSLLTQARKHLKTHTKRTKKKKKIKENKIVCKQDYLWRFGI